MIPARLAARATLVVALALPAGLARAADDGGTRSPFAGGAGIRGLGMGSAFVAAADDASAVIWNPGALGWVPRLQAQTSFTRFEDLGLTESYWGLAVPDWRLGTMAASLRHVGVGGIEGRDDRNVATGQLFSDSETELALAYGRNAGGRWGLGGALKMQRQSLSGLSAGGIGADLGATVKLGGTGDGPAGWMEGVSLGLSVRNALQPALRLDRESVPDPTTLQSGLAVRRLLPNGAALLATLDVEQPRDLKARVHMGAEVRMGPLLAMRAGLHRGKLTAGTGLEWKGLTIEYGFEDRDLGAQQRIGLSHAFGRTVDENRIAARDNAERAAQARLDAAYGERQARQHAELMARVETERAAGRYDNALDVLNTIATLAPGDSTAAALELRILHEKAEALERSGDLTGATLAWARALSLAPGDSISAAGQARCRAASDRLTARSAGRRRRYDEAFDQFLAGNLARAREGFAAILAEEPADVDARGMLARTDQALAQRARERAALPAPVATVRPADARPSPVVPEGVPLTRDQERLVADLYRRGVDAMEAKRPADAIRYWEAVWSMKPSYQKVGEYLRREYLVRGLEDYSAGRLDEAAASWEKALRIDPTDPRAQAYLTRAREQKQRARALTQDAP